MEEQFLLVPGKKDGVCGEGVGACTHMWPHETDEDCTKIYQKY